MIRYFHKYKYKTIKKLAKMCAPPGTSIARISVCCCSEYEETSGYHFTDRDVVAVYLKSKKYYPHVFRANKKRGNISSGRLSRREALIFTLAHELRHRWQYKNHKYIGDRYDEQSELDADLWALKVLKEYRNE